MSLSVVLLIIPIVAVVVGVFFVGFRAADRAKQGGEHAVCDIDGLLPGRISRRWVLRAASAPEQAITQLTERLGAADARVTYRADRELIAFIGSAGQVKFKGMLLADPADMPLRLFARARPADDGAVVELGLDEDFGFQMFVGPARRAWNEKYEAAMDGMEQEVAGALSSSATA